VGCVAHFWLVSFLFWAGSPWIPRKSADTMFRFAPVAPQGTWFELGTGIGANAFPAAREYSARVVAVEIEPLRIGIMQFRPAIGPVADRIQFLRRNLYGMDFRPATAVTGFL
jgi:tRNA1(Val) A37 N6-methylase TrmN6